MGNNICEGLEVGASLGHSGKSKKAGGGEGGNMVGKVRRDMEDGRNKEQLLDFAARLGFAPERVGSHPGTEAGHDRI